MVKGKIEWKDALFTIWTEDLNHAAQFGVECGFAPGTEKRMTRAKPNIWSNMDDFKSKLGDFRAAGKARRDRGSGRHLQGLPRRVQVSRLFVLY